MCRKDNLLKNYFELKEFKYLCIILSIKERLNLKKNVFIIGIILLFTISVLTPIKTGINIKYQVSLNADWLEKAKIITSDGSTGDWFGISVDIYGNYSVIGARDDDNERGSAYIFRHIGNSWEQEQKLLASDGVAGDWFGISVSIFENFIFVGADADDNENGLNAGSVYVYKRNDSTWVPQGKLLASDGSANDYFGRYVSINEDYSIIGAYYDDDIAGSAYVFKRLGDEWIEEDKLIASDRSPGDYFGISTSIQGNYAIIGAYRDDNSNGVDAGSVYVFKRTGGSWYEETKLLASDGAPGDRFGISTSIDSSYLVIGSYYDDGNKGSAYVFNKTSSGWVEENKLVETNGETNNFFGRSVSIKKNFILVGAWGDTGFSGSAYIFKQINSNWFEDAQLKASDAAGNDRFGYQVSLYDRYAVIGAYTDDNENGIDAGAAYIFERIGAEPVPDLTCDGNLNWTDVSSGSTNIGFFTVSNSGEPLSILDWEIQSYPDWGDWTFIPENGQDLTPEHGAVSIEVTVIAPDEENTEFTGEVRIVNSENLSDFCIIPVYLKTPVSQVLQSFQIFERFSIMK